jgi:hypothetical protein
MDVTSRCGTTSVKPAGLLIEGGRGEDAGLLGWVTYELITADDQ